ncbi:uncharacterized protein LOC141696521 [Apium graveolens]|uniref:uncharacterized protein LOC141696521 n=1 Tax=Apium graveolens TaxID=4045 RepID=UPI003D7A4851
MGKLDDLYNAAIAEDADAIAKLEMEADILNEDGETILHIESRKGKTDRVRFILSRFANKNLLIKPTVVNEHTALHYAIQRQHMEVVKVLIDAARRLPRSTSDNDNTDANGNRVTSFQAFIRQVDKDLNSALHIAVINGNLAGAKLLVEVDPSNPGIQNNQGKTPLYIAAENWENDIVKMLCTTSTAPLNFDGPGGRTTALHAVIKRHDEAKVTDVIKIIIDVVKATVILKNHNPVERYLYQEFDKIFSATDEYRQTVLELAVERNYVAVAELILDVTNPINDPCGEDFVSLMPLIYKAMDKQYDGMVKVLVDMYEAGAEASYIRFFDPFSYDDHAALISAIRTGQTENVFMELDSHAPGLVTFVDKLGWTALHHAAYHGFDSIIDSIIQEQKRYGHKFMYQDMVSAPFHVAAERGYTSGVIHLMQVWPSFSSAYINVDKNGQNILHLAALQSNKKMIEGILMYCPEKYKKEFVNQQDMDGNTPLHLLIKCGCFIGQLMKYEGLDIAIQNKERWNPPDMLYFEDPIIHDQVQIKVALDHVQLYHKGDVFSSIVHSGRRERKDATFRKQAELMIHEKHAEMKEATHAFDYCFADAIAGDAISRAALAIEADILNKDGRTILHLESMRGDTKRVEYIVREFANKNLLVKLDTLNQTALHLAAHHGYTQVVEVLINAAALLPSSSANSVSSFHAFIRQANRRMGNTALHLATLNDNVAIVKLLVEADPNDSHVKNNEGRTPIYIAVEKGYKDIVKEICTTCTALSLDGPGGSATALHALIQNIGQGQGM